MMPAAMDGIELHISKRVMHEAHVPLEAEAEAAGTGRGRNAGPRRRLFGEGHGSRVDSIDEFVEALEKSRRVAVVVGSVGIWEPLPGLARIIEVEHRGDGVDAQSIDVIAIEPEEGVCDQESRHFAPAEIIDRRVPIRMKSAARVSVLVQGLAVEQRKAMHVGWKMRWNPVENDGKPGGVGFVDEARKSGWIAESPGRRKQPDRLIAPGFVERMFRDRHQLDMREAEIRGVRDQLFGDLVIGQEAPAFAASPRAEMDLKDRHRLAPDLGFPAASEELFVRPDEMISAGDDRGG